jgi:protein-S-isoprenylcysteine O-methyltransferase Ste14
VNIIDMRPPQIAIGLTLIAATLHRSLHIGKSIRFPCPPAGAVIGTAGFFLMIWAWLLFKKRNVAICPKAKTTSMITRGPYRFSRNPMYLGMVSMMLGLALYVGTLPFYLSAVGYFGVLNFVFIAFEEDKLAKAFGAEYMQYRRRVRRWI